MNVIFIYILFLLGIFASTCVSKDNSSKKRLVNSENGSIKVDSVLLEDDYSTDNYYRRSSDKKVTARTFSSAYRFENPYLKNMLFQLILNARDKTIADPIKATKRSIDRYVKHTLKKAEAQANMKNGGKYSSVSFLGTNILYVCGQKTYVLDNLATHKFCFDGQLINSMF